MDDSRSSVAQPLPFARPRASEAATFLVVAGTAAVWGHTIDEIRIGEFSAIPAGVLNVVLLARWRRVNQRRRAWYALLFGLWWTMTVIPYHLVPLIQGITTWQNVSGLLRVIGGLAMIGAAVELVRSNSTDADASSSGS